MDTWHFPVCSKVELRLVHIFEMRDGKISREIVFDMVRTTQMVRPFEMVPKSSGLEPSEIGAAQFGFQGPRSWFGVVQLLSLGEALRFCFTGDGGLYPAECAFFAVHMGINHRYCANNN